MALACLRQIRIKFCYYYITIAIIIIKRECSYLDGVKIGFSVQPRTRVPVSVINLLYLCSLILINWNIVLEFFLMKGMGRGCSRLNSKPFDFIVPNLNSVDIDIVVSEKTWIWKLKKVRGNFNHYLYKDIIITFIKQCILRTFQSTSLYLS